MVSAVLSITYRLDEAGTSVNATGKVCARWERLQPDRLGLIHGYRNYGQKSNSCTIHVRIHWCFRLLFLSFRIQYIAIPFYVDWPLRLKFTCAHCWGQLWWWSGSLQQPQQGCEMNTCRSDTKHSVGLFNDTGSMCQYNLNTFPTDTCC